MNSRDLALISPWLRLIVFLAILICAPTIMSAGSETVLHAFDPLPNGSTPQAPLTMDSAGNLYGMTVYGGVHGYGTIFKVARLATGKWDFTVLYSFKGGADGANPYGGVAVDNAGNVYGTTSGGGNLACFSNIPGCGVIFELSPNRGGTWTERVLHTFTGSPDGAIPFGGLTFDAAGNLFGTTGSGGNTSCYYITYLGCGTVFELTSHAGFWSYAVLYAFGSERYADGEVPEGNLTWDSKGNLYGTTYDGGDSTNCSGGGCGTVFELSPPSNTSPTEVHSNASSGHWNEQILHNFNGGLGVLDGARPIGDLAIDAAGNLYGATFGYSGSAVIYEISPSGNGWTESILYSFGFSGADGSLVLDVSGNLYGTSLGGGANGTGAVFELSPSSQGSWTLTTLYSFTGGQDGSRPESGLVSDSAGNLYGAATQGGSIGVGSVFEVSPVGNNNWTEKTISLFPDRDGSYPQGSLVADGLGNYYGTTLSGGDAPCTDGSPYSGCGTVFRVSQDSNGDWSSQIVYSFSGGTDSQAPTGNLTLDSAGNLYGAAAGAGSGTSNGQIFELMQAPRGRWRKVVLHNFNGNDGGGPNGGLVFDAAGNLYGTTMYGGMSGRYGTAFELKPNSNGTWTGTTLYNFTGKGDGGYPNGGVVLDQAGNLYGTTQVGGIGEGYFGAGTVFELSPRSTGWTQKSIHLFDQQSGDGAVPLAGLTIDHSGNLYGTTVGLGNTSCSDSLYSGCGVVFELSPTSGGWTENILYAFAGASTGMGPVAGVVFDPNGNLYGTTVSGGTGLCVTLYYTQSLCGTVFKLTPTAAGNWTETVLYEFTGGSDGGAPAGGVTLDASGNIYGTASVGGYISGSLARDNLPGANYTPGGVVFRIAP